MLHIWWAIAIIAINFSLGILFQENLNFFFFVVLYNIIPLLCSFIVEEEYRMSKYSMLATW